MQDFQMMLGGGGGGGKRPNANCEHQTTKCKYQTYQLQMIHSGGGG